MQESSMLHSGFGGTKSCYVLYGCAEVDAALLIVEIVLPFRIQARGLFTLHRLKEIGSSIKEICVEEGERGRAWRREEASGEGGL